MKIIILIYIQLYKKFIFITIYKNITIYGFLHKCSIFDLFLIFIKIKGS